jgi:hypothetical protein
MSTHVTGIAPQSMVSANVEVYPNPVINEIKVISNQCSVSGLEIYNLFGEKIYASPITDNHSLITINVVDLESVVYFIKATTDKGVAVKKFIKQ